MGKQVEQDEEVLEPSSEYRTSLDLALPGGGVAWSREEGREDRVEGLREGREEGRGDREEGWKESWEEERLQGQKEQSEVSPSYPASLSPSCQSQFSYSPSLSPFCYSSSFHSIQLSRLVCSMES